MHGTASLTGELALRVSPEPKNRHTWAETNAEGRKSDAVCSVFGTGRAADSGLTTNQHVQRARVSRVSAA